MKHNLPSTPVKVNSFKHLYQGNFFLTSGILKVLLLLVTTLSLQQLFAQPVITSFSPLSGLPGSTLTIYGSGFSSSTSGNIVFIGGAHAYVLTASPDKLTVQVPRSTTNKPISVTANNLTGLSAVPYVTTYKTGNVITPGTFETPKYFQMDARRNMDTTAYFDDVLTIEDLDNDGKPDIFIKGWFTNFDAFYAIYRNISTPGNISFAPRIYLDVPFQYDPNVLPPADIDGDGKKDILTRNYDEIDILKNNSSPGNINFTNAFPTQSNGSYYDYYLGTADLNSDGKLDLYEIDGNHGDSIAFMQNTSSGGHISFEPPVPLPFSSVSSPNAIVDFNGDGMIDVLSITNDASSNYSIFVNTSRNANISFSSPKNIFPVGNNFLFGVGDFNKDGKPDIAIGRLPYKKDSIYFLVNTSTSGNLSFAEPVAFPFGLKPENAHFVDIDGDGRADITGYDATTGTYVILKNTSTPKRLSFALPVSFPAIKGKDIDFCDFDGDGRQDLIYTLKDYLPFILTYKNQTDTAIGPPSITSFFPATATQFDTLIIEGDNFNGTTNITLGGTAVQSFKIISNKKISAIVNDGSTGDLQVTTRKGVATRSLFTYISDTIVKLVNSTPGIACSRQIVRVKAVVTNADQGIFYSWYRNGNLE